MVTEDAFLKMTRPAWPARRGVPARGKAGHSGRAHSKYSASGAERWSNCSASVELSEGLPDKDSKWSIEGTLAHEVLEAILLTRLELAPRSKYEALIRGAPTEMVEYAKDAARFILTLYAGTPDSDVLVETRVYLKFIHEEMFGTFDGAVIDYFGTLHVFDYKYGAGHSVSVRENLQMIFYAVGLAQLHHWNFKRVSMWIIQPRIKGYDGPTFWEISTPELRRYVDVFRDAVKEVEENPKFVEGSWCHWCKAKSICPLKREKKLEDAKNIFASLPVAR